MMMTNYGDSVNDEYNNYRDDNCEAPNNLVMMMIIRMSEVITEKITILNSRTTTSIL